VFSKQGASRRLPDNGAAALRARRGAATDRSERTSRATFIRVLNMSSAEEGIAWLMVRFAARGPIILRSLRAGAGVASVLAAIACGSSGGVLANDGATSNDGAFSSDGPLSGDAGARSDGAAQRTDGSHDATLGTGGDVGASDAPAIDAATLRCGTSVDAASLGPSCCSDGNAHCIPLSDVPASLVKDLSTCTTSGSGSGVCVPDKIIHDGTSYTPSSCSSIGGAAGACLSKCLAVVATNPDISLLSQGSCDSDELCIPCVNPLTNEATGACAIKGVPCGTDASTSTDGATEDASTGPTCPYTGPALINPDTFPTCSPACAGAHCVPTALVPTSEQSLLAACGSGTTAGFCTPDTFIASEGKAVPPTCTSIAQAEGRCLSTCLPTVATDSSLLPTSTCAAGELCVPCYNPTAADPTAPTGACSIACDRPTQPPVILACPYTGPPIIDPTQFPSCSPTCNGAHCVPAALVASAQQSELSACGSGSTAGFCAPDAVVQSDNHYVPPSCTPFSDPASEGRCTSDCLPGVEAESSELIQGPCAADQLCAPCWNPFSGASTGACNLACDAPTKAQFTFPTCCDDPVAGSGNVAQGTCLPSSLVPQSEASDLDQNVCPSNAADYLCVPNEYLPNSTVPIQTCTTDVGSGACVSNCVNVTGSFLFNQDGCPDNHICVPCDVASIFGSPPPGCN
jgi:hypothetical protein